ncbi:MAG: hypothetical protein ACT4PT_04735 [Methanobacteriota archaeon]
MVRPVSLSDPAFAALRREKRAGESDSDVVLRLVRDARRAGRKDPRAFLLRIRSRRRAMSFEDQLEVLRGMDDADRAKMERRWRERNAGR